jgi:hypothetical protein
MGNFQEILDDLKSSKDKYQLLHKIVQLPMEKLFTITPELEMDNGEATSLFLRLLTDDYEHGKNFISLVGKIQSRPKNKKSIEEENIFSVQRSELKEKLDKYLKTVNPENYTQLYEIKIATNQNLIEYLTNGTNGINGMVETINELYVKSYFSYEYVKSKKNLFSEKDYYDYVTNIYSKYNDSLLNNSELSVQNFITPYIEKAQQANTLEELTQVATSYLDEPLFDTYNTSLRERSVLYTPLTIIFDEFDKQKMDNENRETFAHSFNSHLKCNSELRDYMIDHITGFSKANLVSVSQAFYGPDNFKFEAALLSLSMFDSLHNEFEINKINIERNRLDTILSIREKRNDNNGHDENKKNKKL